MKKSLLLLTVTFISASIYAQTTATGGILQSASSTPLILRTYNSSAWVTIPYTGTSTGYFGINTASPLERLHVTGNTRTSGSFITDAGIMNTSTTSLRLQTGSTDRLTILSNGNVGIGTTTPGQKLDVNGNINATGVYVNNVAFVSSQWTTLYGSLVFNNGGMVSIGTTSQPLGYKLAVGGKIIAEEIVVKLQANWPDYVFDKEYKLPTLQEIQLYIAQHKHLPGVPSAKEIQENGVSVGEMNAILLKKIEELTLYVLNQQQEIEKLKANSSNK